MVAILFGLNVLTWSSAAGVVSSRITVSDRESDVDRTERHKHVRGISINAIQVYHDVFGMDLFYESFIIFQVTEYEYRRGF